MGDVTQIQPHDEVLLVAVQKRALDDTSTQKLVDDVQTAAAQKPRVPIVLDMSRVKFAPSPALGSLVQLSKSFEFDRRQIALVGVDPRVRDSIAVTRLDKLLSIHRTVEEVLAARPPTTPPE